MINFSFYPDASRARALDTRMRAELLRSLEEISAKIQSALPKSEACNCVEAIEPVLSLLRSGHRVSPATFAGYYQLVLSIFNNDNSFTEMIKALVSVVEPRDDRLLIKELSITGLGSQQSTSLYRLCFDTDKTLNFEFLSPGSIESARTKESVDRSLSMMHKIVPAMAAEFEATVSEVILAAASKKPNAASFDGGTSYMLWGSLALSVDDVKSDLEMMETLAHECAHLILFGMTIDEPLVSNDDDELFQSPLRSDPRPMDGIYHATYVSARMHYAMSEARKSCLLNDEQIEECEVLLKASKKAFIDGYSVVADKGVLTRTGSAIMANAYEFMGATRHSI